MIKIAHILVPTDFSEPSDSALAYGRALARRFNACLHVLHVVDNSIMYAGIDGYALDVVSVLAGMVDDAEKHILTCLSEDDWREPKTITEVRTGGPAREIVAYARQVGIDLVVMGSHGRGFLKGLAMGKVTEKVVRIAPCPVLTVRTPEREFVKPDVGADTVTIHLSSTPGEASMIKLENILVATDFGEASATALSYGRALARTFDARLHVLHVTHNALMFTGPEAVGVDTVAVQTRLDEAAMVQLNGLIRDDDRRELQATPAVRSGSSPAQEIGVYAAGAQIDLIVIGTHGRGPMAHLMMGSVAERVVRLAPCPVLTVRHPEHEFVLPDALQLVVSHGQT